MTKPQRILLIGSVSALIVAGAVFAALRLQSRPTQVSGNGSGWVTVKAGGGSPESRILDAVIADALTNKMLARTRQFYGGGSNRTVRYAGFPAGYEPAVAGYDFIPPPSEHSTGRRLTIVLGGLWVDRPPPKDDFFFMLPEVPQGGVLLSIYNTGSGTIGSCAVGYEVQKIAVGWRVRCAGYFDP